MKTGILNLVTLLGLLVSSFPLLAEGNLDGFFEGTPWRNETFLTDGARADTVKPPQIPPGCWPNPQADCKPNHYNACTVTLAPTQPDGVCAIRFENGRKEYIKSCLYNCSGKFQMVANCPKECPRQMGTCGEGATSNGMVSCGGSFEQPYLADTEKECEDFSCPSVKELQAEGKLEKMIESCRKWSLPTNRKVSCGLKK